MSRITPQVLQHIIQGKALTPPHFHLRESGSRKLSYLWIRRKERRLICRRLYFGQEHDRHEALRHAFIQSQPRCRLLSAEARLMEMLHVTQFMTCAHAWNEVSLTNEKGLRGRREVRQCVSTFGCWMASASLNSIACSHTFPVFPEDQPQSGCRIFPSISCSELPDYLCLPPASGSNPWSSPAERSLRVPVRFRLSPGHELYSHTSANGH